MNLQTSIDIYAFGTSEGVKKAWDTRGRGRRWHGIEQTQEAYRDKNGHYIGSRARIHDRLLKKYQNRPSQSDPVIHLVAGGTASGKTTIARSEFANLRSPAIVNMDMPRADLPEFKEVAGTEKAGLLQEEASDIRDKVLMSALAHNNDIALDAVGSPGLAQKLDALEKAGFRVSVSYIHSPVEESLQMAENRARTATNPADRRVIPEAVTRASHDKARGSLPLLMKPGREVKIYDRSGKKFGEPYDLIYHRGADGTVIAKNSGALERMRSAKGEKEIPDVF